MATDTSMRDAGVRTASRNDYKTPKLPEKARVKKRPLHRPAIPSAYTSSGESKVVYVSTKTPFMSAVKRVEKLLGLSEKRSVQSATAIVRNENPRKRRRVDGNEPDEINEIAQSMLERTDNEEVVIKGTGKAIAKALDIAAWFQQRQQYTVRLKTATVESIDDIEIDDDPPNDAQAIAAEVPMSDNDLIEMDMSLDTAGSTVLDTSNGNDAHTEDASVRPHATTPKVKKPLFELSGAKDEVRIRSLSVIEIYVSSR